MAVLPTENSGREVVIIGGGFGGLYTAKALRRAPVRVALGEGDSGLGVVRDRAGLRCAGGQAQVGARAGVAGLHVARGDRAVGGGAGGAGTEAGNCHF